MRDDKGDDLREWKAIHSGHFTGRFKAREARGAIFNCIVRSNYPQLATDREGRALWGPVVDLTTVWSC